MKFNKTLRRRLLLKSSTENFKRSLVCVDFKRSLVCVDFKRSLLFSSFFNLQIYEGKLLKKSTLHKTSLEVFLCKYWLNFEFEKFSKMPQKTSWEVFSDKHVSFAIDWSLSETWLFIEDFSGSLLGKYFYKSLLNVARSLPGILLQLTLFS